MTSSIKTIPCLSILLLSMLLFAALGRATSDAAQVLPDELGGTTRYLAYVSTDKPIYREDESVYLRTVFLDAGDNTPLDADMTTVRVKITGPKGDVVHEGTARDSGSAVGYQWTIPTGTTGGTYMAKISSPTVGIPETTRQFEIRAYRAPRIKSQIQFARDAYGIGDQVSASMSLERAEGGIPEQAQVTAIARVDGQEIFRAEQLDISDTGVVSTSFPLPDSIVSGEGSLSFIIEDGGVIESASKSLPILLQTLDIAFYPESGELVAGLATRVYFQARLPNGKPADVRGAIVELTGKTPDSKALIQFSSEHEGRGRFTFTPEKGKRYAAIFSEPSGITEPATLPSVQTTGTIIKSSQNAYAFGVPVELTVSSKGARAPVTVTLHKRETLLDTQNVTTNSVSLDAGDAEGVLIATAWNESGQPVAERLIYRHPRFGLNIELTLSEGPFVPGAPVSVDILTTDNNGNPVEAIVGVSVTDDTVLELIEKRQQAPRLPAMVYLENDVLDLADAQVYFDSSNPSAATDIDLLLGTQGWRRFVLVNYTEIKNKFPSQTARAMAQSSVPANRIGGNNVRQLLERNLVQFAELKAAAPVAEARLEKMAVAAVQVEEEIHENLAEPAGAAIRQDLQVQAVAADEDAIGLVARERFAAPSPAAVFIREFAFQTDRNRKPEQRTDFTETLYWNTGVKTNARDGRASIEFSLSDSITSFSVMADGYARNGAIGTGNTLIASVEPFYISAKMPLHSVAGDMIELPVTMINATDKPMKSAIIKVSGEGIEALETEPVTLAAGERFRHLATIKTTTAGTFPITVSAQAGSYKDHVTHELHVASAGFPAAINDAGLVSADNPFKTTFHIPREIVKGSLIAKATLYPSPLASMQGALAALLREPHGCFEQTSSSNYPLVMAQQYFDSHTGIDPATLEKSRALLKTGYDKLTGFESAENGYEWFGANPAHEALTAYGLMQFTDMSKVMKIDGAMVERTRQWLLDQRTGNGGFKRNERALDSFGRAPENTTDAYIVWALLESGQNPQSLQAEIQQIKDSAFNGDDSYTIALAANILYLAADHTSADALATKLVQASNNQGAVEGAATSITGSSGNALVIETTSLALLAWMRNTDQQTAAIEHSMRWLFESSKAGRFGSTQSTVLALKAINRYNEVRAVPLSAGSVQLYVDGTAIGDPVSFTKASRESLELPDFSTSLVSGKQLVELRMSNGAKMPFSLQIGYNTQLPASPHILPIRLETSLSHSTVSEGEPMEMQVSINTSGQIVPSPIAIVGIPAGLELQHEQLKELVAIGSISAYEVRDSELVLYWRALKANENRVLPIALSAQIPGSYTSPASRIYPYYTNELQHWVSGHSVSVVAQ